LVLPPRAVVAVAVKLFDTQNEKVANSWKAFLNSSFAMPSGVERGEEERARETLGCRRRFGFGVQQQVAFNIMHRKKGAERKRKMIEKFKSRDFSPRCCRLE
jgi:hypothetical protein